MYLCVCVFVCLSVSVCLPVCLSACLRLHLHLRLRLRLFVDVCIAFQLSLCLGPLISSSHDSVYVSIYTYTSVSVCKSVSSLRLFRVTKTNAFA